MKKYKKILGIPITFLLIGILGIGLVSAGLVNYFARVQTDISVESPIVLEQEGVYEFEGTVLNDGHNHYLLVYGENKLDVNVPVIFDLTITAEKDGTPFDVDGEGLHIAVSDDINYCLTEQGDMTDVSDCRTDYVQYLTNNPEWFDWKAMENYAESTFVSPVINYNEDSFVDWATLGYVTWSGGSFTAQGTEDIKPGEFVVLITVKADLDLDLGTYTFTTELRP